MDDDVPVTRTIHAVSTGHLQWLKPEVNQTGYPCVHALLSISPLGLLLPGQRVSAVCKDTSAGIFPGSDPFSGSSRREALTRATVLEGDDRGRLSLFRRHAQNKQMSVPLLNVAGSLLMIFASQRMQIPYLHILRQRCALPG